MNIQTSILKNGIRIVTSTIPHVESVTMGIWTGVGSRYEPRQVSGISHLIEHMLFKGTKTRSSKDISREIEGKGGDINAITQEETTCYYARVPAEHIESSFDVLSDIYCNSVIDEKELEKERKVIIEEIMMYRDQPSYLVEEMLASALWHRHPLSRPITGTPETLRNLSRDILLDFIKTHYTTHNTCIAFAGKVEHNKCVEMVKDKIQNCTENPPPPFKKITNNIKQIPLSWKTKEVEQTHIALGIRLPFGYHDPQKYALKLLNVILGENMSSRLFTTVREKYGLAYSIQSSLHLFNETGVLEINAGLDHNQTFKGLQLILSETGKIKQRPVSSRELKLAKDYVIGSIKLGLESTSYQMLWIGENMSFFNRVIMPEEIISQINAVTQDDIQSLARRIIKNTQTSLAIIAPDFTRSDADKLRKFLQILN